MRKILITGGAGFIGTNTAIRFLKNNDKVSIYDDLSRKGTSNNIELLKKEFPKVEFIQADIRNNKKIEEAVKGKDIVFHFAGQVAVTTSVLNPREDFDINALGTLNILEAVRKYNPKAILLYTSTNKVYGGMEDEKIIEKATRYEYKNLPFGISEKYPLDFHSPYGCSKGTADQYVRDYARIYDLKTIVFRQSCIYGPYQFGIEDQGWVAWFVLAVLFNKQISIYGDGKQVRDLLFIGDLIDAYEKAISNSKVTQGQIYNIGGGKKFSYSIWREFQPVLEKKIGKKIKITKADWRPGDQLIYISDTRKAKKDFRWSPKITLEDGLSELIDWAKLHQDTIEKVIR